MPVVTRRELLEAGVHFGHQTRRWNPKMGRFLYGERSGIYIIDLEKTLTGLEEAYNFARDLGRRGGVVLFVGTKKQAQEVIVDNADREVVFGLLRRGVVEDRLDHRRRELFRRQPVPAGDEAHRRGER